MKYPSIRLKKGREKSLERFHPWIFSGGIQSAEKGINDGDLVRITDFQDTFLALAHYQEDGSISGRVISWEEENIDKNFFERKLRSAWKLRETAGLTGGNTNVFRWVFAEGDGLPGLIIDKYGPLAVIQCHTTGMSKVKHQITEAILSIDEAGISSVYDKSKSYLEGESDKYLAGERTDGLVKENGLIFRADWESGQKTGFFIDQRDNRELLRKYSKGKKVLNTFSYTGGFSIYALAGGAAKAVSVDISSRAVELANENAELNQFSDRHQGIAADVFDYLKKCEQGLFDVIVLDPPAFAKSHRVSHNAIQGYKRLNMAAIDKIAPHGLLFTFSCSQVIDPVTFNKTIFSAAIEAGRQARIIHYVSQPADHPVSIFHPEGQYLKGLVLEII